MPRRGAAFALGVALLLNPWAHADEPMIYKWVDENGIAHYTTDPDRIPAALRDRMRLLRRADEPTAPRTPNAATPRPGTEAWLEQDAQPEAPTGPTAEVPPVSSGAPTLKAAGSGPDAARRLELDAQIAAVEAEIAQQEELLKALISDATRVAEKPLADEPEFREVARRLPALQADLRALRDQRDRLAEPAPAQP